MRKYVKRIVTYTLCLALSVPVINGQGSNGLSVKAAENYSPTMTVDMTDELEVIVDTGGVPFSPRIKSDDGKSYLDCPRVVTDLVYNKAKDWYGTPLPYNIEERIAKELYGDSVFESIKYLLSY